VVEGAGDALHAAPVDDTRGHVHEHVERDRVLALGGPEEARQQRPKLRPDALDRAQGTEQGIEDGRAGHGFSSCQTSRSRDSCKRKRCPRRAMASRLGVTPMTSPQEGRKEARPIAKPTRSWPLKTEPVKTCPCAGGGCATGPGAAARASST